MAYSEFRNVLISGITTAIPKMKDNLILQESSLEKADLQEFTRTSGIIEKRISLDEQTASDLGFVAAKSLLRDKRIDASSIGVIVFVSRTPDYRNPPSATVLQHRLGIPIDCLAYDVNMGSSGFVYGLQIVCSLVESMPVKYGLLIVGDTSSKLTEKNNPNSLKFGDGSSAILLEKRSECDPIQIYSKSYSKDFNSYILRDGGFRLLEITNTSEKNPEQVHGLYINESKYGLFALSEIPLSVESFLLQTNTSIKDYDFVAIHQESKDILDKISSKLGIAPDKIHSNLNKFGNTAGASIPLLLNDVFSGKDKGKVRIMSIGFGEGFSLGVAGFSINSSGLFPLIESDEYFTEGAVSREL